MPLPLLLFFWLPSYEALLFTAPFDTSPYTDGYKEFLDGTAGVWWEVSLDDTIVEFAVAADVTDSEYLGLGVNGHPGMPGADIAFFTLPGGVPTLEDRYATSYGEPAVDAHTDITFIDGGSSSGIMWYTFSRSLAPCDQKQDLKINSPYTMVYLSLAHGRLASYHGSNRESIAIKLKAPVSTALPPDAVKLDLIGPTVSVPLADGYMCSYHALPNDMDYHIVQFEAVPGSSASTGLFHHVNLQGCSAPLSGVADGDIVPCGLAMSSCSSVLLTGGYGTPEALPNDVGLAIGPHGVSYAVLSIHFYNPSGITGQVDTGTGYGIWYTPTLRPNTIGRFSLAAADINIPPETYDYDIAVPCTGMCTELLLPPTGITITDVAFHQHGHGAKIYLEQVRDGVAIAEIARVEPWDQSAGTVKTDSKVLPGDKLVLHCVYDNPKTIPVTYGDGANNEMCVATISHYPHVITSCYDLPNGLPGEPPAECDYCIANNLHLDPSSGPCRQCKWDLPRTSCPSEEEPNRVVYDEPDRFIEYDPVDLYAGCPSSARCTLSLDEQYLSPCRGEQLEGTKCRVQCGSGYVGDEGEQTCGPDGTFSGSLPSCSPADVWCDPVGDFCVSWTIDEGEGTITFSLEGRTAGWMALGFPDAPGAMAPADVMMCYKWGATVKGGDRQTTTYASPAYDAEQNVEVLGGESVDGKLLCQLRRPLDSPDTSDKDILDAMHIVWALGTYPISSESAMMGKHFKKGTGHIEFRACVPNTCLSLEAECGTVPDGCGASLDCGTCSTGTCMGGGEAHKCGSGAVLCSALSLPEGHIAACAGSMLMGQTCSLMCGSGTQGPPAEYTCGADGWEGVLPTCVSVSRHCFPGDAFCVQWARTSDTITFDVEATTLGYAAFGIAETSGAMFPADIAVCYHDGEAVRVSDRKTTAYIAPVADEQQDWTARYGASIDGVLHCTFSRALVTGDGDDDVDVVLGDNNVVWALADTAPEYPGAPMFKHLSKGHGVLNFQDCTPTTCAASGKECGEISNGCGGSMACGECPGTDECGPDNTCVCTPATCAAACGVLPDGCGATLTCSACPGGETCGAGGPNVCGVGVCTPASCGSQHCGAMSDGCGVAVLDCGTCAAGFACGGDNMCVSTSTCASHSCSRGTLKGSPGTIVCAGAPCSAAECCDLDESGNGADVASSAPMTAASFIIIIVIGAAVLVI